MCKIYVLFLCLYFFFTQHECVKSNLILKIDTFLHLFACSQHHVAIADYPILGAEIAKEQETFLAPSANKQTHNSDSLFSNHHPSQLP